MITKFDKPLKGFLTSKKKDKEKFLKFKDQIQRKHRSVKNREYIKSYGIILFWYDEEKREIYYLISQKRDTFEYVDFLRGRYYRVPEMIKNMAIFEREFLLKYPYSELIKDLGAFTTNYSYPSKSITIDSKLRDYIKNSNGIKEPYYEFPKGRRNKGEKYINCAIREFKEETRLDCDLYFLNHEDKLFPPVIDEYKGSDNIDYKSYLYICRCYVRKPIIKKLEIKDGVRKFSISNEVNELKWLKCNKTLNKLQIRQHLILRDIDTFLKKNIANLSFKKID